MGLLHYFYSSKLFEYFFHHCTLSQVATSLLMAVSKYVCGYSLTHKNQNLVSDPFNGDSTSCWLHSFRGVAGAIWGGGGGGGGCLV